MADPELLLLDEPSLGLAPMVVREILGCTRNLALVARLRDDGLSILLVEQNARAALRVSSEGYVMETGSVVMHGAAADLLADKKMVESNFGIRANGKSA
jgi:branched-chain amino acid transport system ATP-binding protein